MIKKREQFVCVSKELKKMKEMGNKNCQIYGERSVHQKEQKVNSLIRKNIWLHMYKRDTWDCLGCLIPKEKAVILAWI